MGVERGLEKGTIPRGTELFMFTDNFVMERAYFRGTSKSKRLFDLVLKLHKLEMSGELHIHLIWVAGTRMIAQGTDGISRGDLSNGVMGGKSMLNYVPLDEGVKARAPSLFAWVTEACWGAWTALEPKQWYHEVHLSEGSFIWSPPPAIADVALEQLCEARHTHPQSSHIFLCPALMTSRWRKRLSKVADAMFTIPVGSTLWPQNMHEPIIVALICPLLASSPWQVRDTRLVAELRHQVSGVWSPSLDRERSGLRQFWEGANEWGGM